MKEAQEIIDRMKGPGNGRILVFSGPSGAGKSTICRAVLERFDNLTFSVSHTTRDIRAGESDGRDYYFVSRERFQDMVNGQAFAEYAEVYGNNYGTARETLDDIMASGHNALLDIDVQGGEQIKAAYPELTTMVFVLPPSMETLEARLRKRGKDDDEVIVRRLNQAAAEIERITLYDYVLINDDLENAIDTAILLVSADGHRVNRYQR